MFDGALYSVSGNLPEFNPAVVFLYLEDMCQVPGDSLTFPIWVCGNQDAVGLLSCFLQFLIMGPSASNSIIFRLKVILNVHTKLAFKEVTHMAHGCFNDVVSSPRKRAIVILAGDSYDYKRFTQGHLHAGGKRGQCPPQPPEY